jgi:hypothetical protein
METFKPSVKLYVPAILTIYNAVFLYFRVLQGFRYKQRLFPETALTT